MIVAETRCRRKKKEKLETLAVNSRRSPNFVAQLFYLNCRQFINGLFDERNSFTKRFSVECEAHTGRLE